MTLQDQGSQLNHSPCPRCGISLCLTAAGRPPSSATGRADEDGDEVADEMGEEEDEELRWKDSGDLSSAVKTP